MMREIKFRAWNHASKMMVTPKAFTALIEGKKVAGQHPVVIEEYEVERVELRQPKNPGLFSIPEEVRWTEQKTREVEQPVVSMQGNPFNANELVVMQYTGLKDKSGVDIYEGDILAFGSHETNSYGTCEIRWSEGAARFYQVPYMAPNVTDWKLCEVVGNIHENPELLKANS